jgi:hypothetical protein
MIIGSAYAGMDNIGRKGHASLLVAIGLTPASYVSITTKLKPGRFFAETFPKTIWVQSDQPLFLHSH